MPFFPSEFIERVRNYIPISEVVKKYVRLQSKTRGEFVGLCPFHQEKTPSFTVSDLKGFYHCFGCGAHGDVVNFTMHMERLTYPEAIRRLAEQASLPIPVTTPRQQEQYEKSKTLYQVMEEATKFYQSILKARGGTDALEYLKKRGLSDKTIERFRLGFAPDLSQNLREYMTGRGFQVSLLLEAGLIGQNESGDTYDRFRGRIIFPILDLRSRVIAFGGRTIGNAEPKYLNSPDTPLFHKGHILYNLNQAGEDSRKSGNIIVVEGYMDVIALDQSGIPNSVAPLGTALTEHHLKLLWQVSPEPICCFDGDNAGERAANRAANLALTYLTPGCSLRFLNLPKGQDPDDFVCSSGKDAFIKLVSASQTLSEKLWQIERGMKSTETPEQKSDLKERLLKLAATIPHKDISQFYREFFIKRLQILSHNRLYDKYSKKLQEASPLVRQLALKPSDPILNMEYRLIGLIINHPELIDHAMVEEEFAHMGFSSAKLDNLRLNILELAFQGVKKRDLIITALQEKGFAKDLEYVISHLSIDSYGSEGASMEAAISGWRYLYAGHQLESMKSVYNSEVNRVSNDNDLERALELQKQISALEEKVQDAAKLIAQE